MPIAGFRKDDEVLSPSGKKGIVIKVIRFQGREKVTYMLDNGTTRTLDAAALKLQRER